MAALFDVSPTPVSVALFAIGWVSGWLLLCRPRHLRRRSCSEGRCHVAVVIPARNEAASIGAVVTTVTTQLRPGDEAVVIDDGSTDDTATAAARAGARVIVAGPLPPGWAGKPHACAVGAAAVRGDVLVFVDADVSLGEDLLDGLAAEIADDPDALVSVQPWHVPVRTTEQLSLIFNVTALMGCGAFSAVGQRARTRVAFGPVLALGRATYESAGGHAAVDVRGAILEDIALARAVGRSRLFVGQRRGTTFRMYPAGLRQLVEGWTKGIGIGASAAPWWAVAGTAAWVTSLAGGWLASPWFAVASVLQLAVLARLAGRFSPVAIVLYPIPVAFFVVVFVRSAVRRLRHVPVTWRGRSLRPDQDTR